jgi:hypothetical protein
MPTIKSSYRDISDYRNTTVHDNGNGRAVVLYSTLIFDHDRSDGTITLRTGGHTTATTKRRMNECLRAGDWPWSVVQRDHIWYVEDDRTGKRVEFNGPHVIDL